MDAIGIIEDTPSVMVEVHKARSAAGADSDWAAQRPGFVAELAEELKAVQQYLAEDLALAAAAGLGPGAARCCVCRGRAHH